MSMLLPPGTLLDGRYEVVRCLGQGGMATVYEVKHVGLGSTHALKVLAAELSSNAEVLKRFLAEGRIQAQLKHPNVVGVTEIVTSPVAGLVMEYVEGGTLADWLSANGRARTREELLELFLPVLEAVGEAHRHGVVHRDLKPENVILGRNAKGRVWPRVTDFGIARVAAEGTRLTRTGARMGTLHYMSPEQVQGAENVDARSDIFALGAILYELVTGQRAFDGKSDLQVMKAIDEGRFRPVRELMPEVDPVVATSIEKALKVDLSARFQTCEEFERALEERSAQAVVAPVVNGPPRLESREAVAGEPTAAAQARGEPTPRSGRNVIPFLAAGVVVLTVYGVIGSLPQRESMVTVAGGGGVAPFKLDETEVTVAAYAACVKAGKCTEPETGGKCNWRVSGKEQHPINCVNWMQADGYCKAQGKRLPTENEWEWAASNGGTTTYPWGNEAPDDTRAQWSGLTDKNGTVAVGTHTAGGSVGGHQDLSGNVWEWTASPFDSSSKVLRGGSWGGSNADFLRASFRGWGDPTGQFDFIGFRCAQ